MKTILSILRPSGYNSPTNIKMLWNQWLHQGFLWKWYSYEFYSKHQKETI